MKKIVSIIMLLSLAVGLCACGNATKCSQESCDEKIFKKELCRNHYTDNTFIGRWSFGDGIGILTFYKGGNGQLVINDHGREHHFSGTWEVNHDCDVLSFSYAGFTTGYQYDEKNNTLTDQKYPSNVYKKQ